MNDDYNSSRMNRCGKMSNRVYPQDDDVNKTFYRQTTSTRSSGTG